MDEYHKVRLMTEVSEGRVRGRPRLGRMEGVKMAICDSGDSATVSKI